MVASGCTETAAFVAFALSAGAQPAGQPVVAAALVALRRLAKHFAAVLASGALPQTELWLPQGRSATNRRLAGVTAAAAAAAAAAAFIHRTIHQLMQTNSFEGHQNLQAASVSPPLYVYYLAAHLLVLCCACKCLC